MQNRDSYFANLQTGYCTNVHVGVGLEQTRGNLERYALAVKRRFSPVKPMGVGLWLSATAARQLRTAQLVEEWAAWLHECGLIPFTLNGFPHGDFHQRVVKHQVYLPTWSDPARLEYTRDLIAILHGLLPAGMSGSISTLPLAWGIPPPPRAVLDAAAAALRQAAAELARLEAETGRWICLCLEPEPGCVLQRSEDVVRFFHEHLLPGHDERPLRRYLRVCHDVCHQVVMYEDQAEVLARYRAAGIGVGKVQVSSAVCLDLEKLTAEDRLAALEQLAGFHEERYLHQTVTRSSPDTPATFFEDLPQALAAHRAIPPNEWRVHFHVPIYLERFGRLVSSRWAIDECLRAITAHQDTAHFEVETYAWSVLPRELQQPDLAMGIADEMQWFAEIMRSMQKT